MADSFYLISEDIEQVTLEEFLDYITELRPIRLHPIFMLDKKIMTNTWVLLSYNILILANKVTIDFDNGGFNISNADKVLHTFKC